MFVRNGQKVGSILHAREDVEGRPARSAAKPKATVKVEKQATPKAEPKSEHVKAAAAKPAEEKSSGEDKPGN